jgi:23S rRNA (uracil1939-C5)-methyltransferase
MAAAANLPRAKELRGAVRTSGDDVSLVIEGGDAWPAARAFVESCPTLSLVLWIDRTEVRHVVHDRRRGDATAAAFEQVNPPVALAIRDRVVSLVETEHPASVVDAYAGSGALSARLADGHRRVVAIERDREAVQRAQTALGGRARVVRGAVEDHLTGHLPADIVVLNPPRGGVDGRVCDALQGATPLPRLIVYVSCDAATLARDVGRLPAYRVRSVTPFDMFPQTAHVETVCTLVPEVV